ncbi:hypothetical protein EGW08_001171 [Elysia chlorotica]|uniref:Endothelin-converting enzyme 1 n=1 Tax=Elysia chlorotica TaxID=188477 RepID=A0A3S1AG46_ELYCH|nr:hypothetical protein EGW08_001171 [Elysia chlorotica]
MPDSNLQKMTMNGKSSNAKYITAEEGGTQVEFAGPQMSGTRRGPARWSRVEQMLTLACLLLTIIVVVLIIMIVTSTASHDKSKVSRKKPVLAASIDGGYPIPDDLELTNICLTPGCVNAASRLVTTMDSSVEPCNNFYDFACGNWNKKNTIPDDQPSYNTFSKLGDEIQVILKSYIEKDVDLTKDSNSTAKAKHLYRSCMNETQIDSEGLTPIHEMLADLGGWPILEGTAAKPRTQADVLDLLIKLNLIDQNVLIWQTVSADDKDSSVNIIQLDQSNLGMPVREYFLDEVAAARRTVYQKYMHDVAVMLGADAETAQRDVEEMMLFEIELAKITIPSSERRDNEEMYNKMTVGKLQELVPEFDWLVCLQRLFGHVGIEITDQEPLVVYAPSYLAGLGKLYQSTDNRVIVNYLLWRLMMNWVNNLPSQYRNIKNEYIKNIFGSQADPPRWAECVSFVNMKMGNALGRLFVEEHFDESSKDTALEMIHNIRDSFYELLDEATWMDEPTRIVAKEKADAISEKIGYDDSILVDNELNKEYEEVEYYPDRYVDNIITFLKHTASSKLKNLRTPVDRTKWSTSTTPAVVNAFYSPTKNQIMFPAGILQPPFYSKHFPKYLNYGGIGMVIGHEITHGFDDRGRQYDKDGNLVKWWDDVVIHRFKERAQCIIDQYSNYTVPEIDMPVNGLQTQGENIADNGGIKEAYRAYRKYTQRQHTQEKRLPGLLQFSGDQLFFINFAQVWCGVMRPQASINRIMTGVHSPGRFRVIGTLQNMPEFSEAFQCPAGSYMNRKERCSVW